MSDVSFTRTVRRALQTAREEAIRLFHHVVDTQHIPLGILRHDVPTPHTSSAPTYMTIR